MKALIKEESTSGLSLDDIPISTPGPHDILIRVRRTSLCGTDLQLYQSNTAFPIEASLPMIIGHECAGEIVEIGAAVQGYERGQLVSGETHVTCGWCRFCLEGHRDLCLKNGYTGINRSGVFAEYLTLPANAVWVHSPGIDVDIATLFESLGTAVHAALQCELLGKAVIITGASPEGLMAAAVCHHAGARQVVVIDQSLQKLRLALSLGATHVINPDEDDIDAVKQGLGLHSGFDSGLEMSGNEDAYATLFAHIRHRGQIVMVGVPTAPRPMDWRSVIFKQLSVKGVWGRAMPQTWQQMSGLIEGGLDLSRIITKRIHYTQFEEGFEALRLGMAGKVIMSWESG